MAKEKELKVKQKVEKIAEKHLTKLQNIINGINALQFNIGKLEAQKHDILHRLATAQDKIALMQDTLQKEYGTNDVNIKDGTINWPKEESKKDEK